MWIEPFYGTQARYTLGLAFEAPEASATIASAPMSVKRPPHGTVVRLLIRMEPRFVPGFIDGPRRKQFGSWPHRQTRSLT